MEQVKVWFQNNWPFLLKLAAVVIVGFIAIKIIVAVINAIFRHGKMEKNAHSFIITIIKIALYIIWLVAILGLLGIDTSSFVAITTALGLALSLALQDTLSNFASGILIIANKPFIAGDFVEVAGVQGTVQEVKISVTILLTTDNKVVTIPNSTVAKSEIINFSTSAERRVDFDFGVAYGSDIDKVKGVIMSVCDKHELVIHDKGITVRLKTHGESALIFTARVWTRNENYWDVYWDINEQVVNAFNEAGIEIPFNQVDVHMRND